MTAQMRSHFEHELTNLNESVLEMGARSRRAVAEALQAMEDDNGALASEVIARDEDINRLRFQIEKQCYALIATEQPVASDLRAVVAALIIVIDLERIADHGKKIARIWQRMQDDPRQLPFGHLFRLGEDALSLLDRVLRAYSERDVAEAAAVCKDDDQVDARYKQSFNILLENMIEDPRTIGAATHLLHVGHELERVGDRATNIAERLIYSVTGELTELNF